MTCSCALIIWNSFSLKIEIEKYIVYTYINLLDHSPNHISKKDSDFTVPYATNQITTYNFIQLQFCSDQLSPSKTLHHLSQSSASSASRERRILGTRSLTRRVPSTAFGSSSRLGQVRNFPQCCRHDLGLSFGQRGWRKLCGQMANEAGRHIRLVRFLCTLTCG